jgi:hypothetical protein
LNIKRLVIKYVTALAITHCQDKNKFLIVRRPLDDDDLPGMWGLPAISSAEKDDPKISANQIGFHKLGVSLKLGPKLISGNQTRGTCLIHMDLYFAFMVGTPCISSATGINYPGTIYTDWRWGIPLSLKQSARKGSLCCKLLIDATEYGPLS